MQVLKSNTIIHWIFIICSEYFLFVSVNQQELDTNVTAVDEMEVEKSLDHHEPKDALLVCDEKETSQEKENIDGDSGNNNIGDDDDHVEHVDKDEVADNSSSSSSKSEESNEEDNESINASPTIHFFFNFVNAVEFSDSTHDRTLWTLKTFKEYLKTYFQTEAEAEERPDQEADNEITLKNRCAKVFFIFRELNAIVGTALIHQKDLLQLQSPDTVWDEWSDNSIILYVFMYCMYVRMCSDAFNVNIYHNYSNFIKSYNMFNIDVGKVSLYMYVCIYV